MEALLDLLNSYWSDEVVLRRVLVGLSAATIFILGLGLTVLIMNLTGPVRRRMGLVEDVPVVKDRLMIRVATALGPVASYVLPQKDLERDNVTRRLVRAGARPHPARAARRARRIADLRHADAADARRATTRTRPIRIRRSSTTAYRRMPTRPSDHIGTMVRSAMRQPSVVRTQRSS